MFASSETKTVLVSGFSYISGNAIIEIHVYRPESHTQHKKK